jgi:hypothetical protein
MTPSPTAFVGIDWSGARGPRQHGIQLACAMPGNAAPQRIDCPSAEKWGREAVFDWLLALARGSAVLPPASPRQRSDGPVLVGVDFAFAHPFVDQGVYYPGLPPTAQPRTPSALWQMIDQICSPDPHLYGGRVFATPPWADYYLSPHNHGAPRFASRRRVTEHASRVDGRSPSPTFKAIGADNVATGSMAGMRLLHRLKTALAGDLVVWPFDPVSAAEKEAALIIVEIFPSLYFHAAGLNPARNAAADPMFMSKALAAYDSHGVPQDFQPLGSDADEADAIISAAAMRHFARNAGCWSAPAAAEQAARSEGWIFGVGVDGGSKGAVGDAITG